MANRLRLTRPKREEFLETLRLTGNVSVSARSIGTSRAALYSLRERDQVFAKAWDEVLEEAIDRLEAEAVRRAVEGIDRPVYQRGELVGTERVYSDTLLLALLRAHRPEKYRERYELSGPDGSPPVLFQLNLAGKPPTERVVTIDTAQPAALDHQADD